MLVALALATEKAEGGQTDDQNSTTEPKFCATGFEDVCNDDSESVIIVIGESHYQEQKRLEEAERAKRLAEQRNQRRLSSSPGRTTVPPQTPTADQQQVIGLIRSFSEQYGINPDLPLAIARCESGYNSNAKNKGSTASGVFQYLSGTWANTPEGKVGRSVFDAEANIEAAVRHIAKKGTAPWNASRHCWSQ